MFGRGGLSSAIFTHRNWVPFFSKCLHSKSQVNSNSRQSPRSVCSQADCSEYVSVVLGSVEHWFSAERLGKLSSSSGPSIVISQLDCWRLSSPRRSRLSWVKVRIEIFLSLTWVNLWAKSWESLFLKLHLLRVFLICERRGKWHDLTQVGMQSWKSWWVGKKSWEVSSWSHCRLWLTAGAWDRRPCLPVSSHLLALLLAIFHIFSLQQI